MVIFRPKGEHPARPALDERDQIAVAAVQPADIADRVGAEAHQVAAPAEQRHHARAGDGRVGERASGHGAAFEELTTERRNGGRSGKEPQLEDRGLRIEDC